MDILTGTSETQVQAETHGKPLCSEVSAAQGTRSPVDNSLSKDELTTFTSYKLHKEVNHKEGDLADLANGRFVSLN